MSSSQRLMYPDALTQNTDLRNILDAFNGLRIDSPRRSSVPIPLSPATDSSITITDESSLIFTDSDGDISEDEYWADQEPAESEAYRSDVHRSVNRVQQQSRQALLHQAAGEFFDRRSSHATRVIESTSRHVEEEYRKQFNLDDRAQAERAQAERAQAERVQAQAERVQDERILAQRAQADERVQAKRDQAERAEAERVQAELVQAKRVQAERAEAQRVRAEHVQAERVQAERAQAQRVRAERVQAERVQAERAQAERVRAERVRAERVRVERAQTERADGERHYVVSAGREAGPMDSWHRAAHSSQGHPNGLVRRVNTPPPINTPPPVNATPQKGRGLRNNRTKRAWVVFEGTEPGVYDSWEDAKVRVINVPRCVHEGYERRLEAETAYVLAYGMGLVRSLPRRGESIIPPAPSAPTPAAVLAAFLAADDGFLGPTWHVVFKGRSPGVYPAWCFAASQTQGVANSVYQKYPTRADAQRAFDAATEAEIAFMYYCAPAKIGNTEVECDVTWYPGVWHKRV
ncbi:hypothetical protein FIBSPDRAFT_899896 [Athelia psychrophila]|uniref:Ribonuclease H1 N-terminal domain-containing protein n=1 Tax=Athelia psychrophila TaxID=1759441 RepID=A0A165Z3T8_9AGAM|nr:hypothetical protein FIBSPDRAFT_899896 [Fibularhizoctonia sp. CBS 109695]